MAPDTTDESLSEFEEGQASAIAVLALEGTLSRSDMLVLPNMFSDDVLRNAHKQMEGNLTEATDDGS